MFMPISKLAATRVIPLVVPEVKGQQVKKLAADVL